MKNSPRSLNPLAREQVEIDPRRAMTSARKQRIWDAWGGKCWFCRMPVPVRGPAVVYDHIPPLWIKGSDADDDIGPIHAAPCNKLKTAADQSAIAKIKRIRAREDGTRRPRQKIPAGAPLQSRGFDETKTRTFKGKVVPRQRSQRT